MRYSVVHRTSFLYSEPARDNVNEVRLCPLATPGQAPEFFVLNVVPATRLRRYTDLFSNPVHHFELAHPHSRLVIEARSRVEVGRRVDYEELPYGSSHRDLPSLRSRDECHEFLQDSTYVRRSPEIWREAIDIQDSSTDVFQTAYALMSAIYEKCSYEPGITDSTTTAQHVFEVKRGVCQDFAHLLLAYCRCLGIPARYVSGYIWDRGHDVMRGSQASHAWVEVFLPQAGWIGLDPTNNKVVNEQYIVIATGRDYDDVAPVRGTFYGGGHHRAMQVHVEVRRLGHDDP